MKKIYGLILLYLFLTTSAFSQIIVEGALVDQKGQPVPFATVGIFELSIGTITNEDGSFELEVDTSVLDRELTFSAIGYERKSFLISDLLRKEELRIVIEESVTALDEVVVTSSTKNLKRIRMVSKGNFLTNTGTMRLDRNQNGGAMALLIDHDNTPFWVSKAKLRIRHSSLESFKVRVRFMSVDQETGAPSEDLVAKDLIFESDMKRGWLKMDFTKENIWLKETSFFIVLEWIMDAETRSQLQEQIAIYLSETPDAISESSASVEGTQVNERMIKNFQEGVWFGTLLDKNLTRGYNCYYRLNSLDKWKVSLPVLTAEVYLSDYKE